LVYKMSLIDYHKNGWRQLTPKKRSKHFASISWDDYYYFLQWWQLFYYDTMKTIYSPILYITTFPNKLLIPITVELIEILHAAVYTHIRPMNKAKQWQSCFIPFIFWIQMLFTQCTICYF
jgi:hypothetical protein